MRKGEVEFRNAMNDFTNKFIRPNTKPAPNIIRSETRSWYKVDNSNHYFHHGAYLPLQIHGQQVQQYTPPARVPNFQNLVKLKRLNSLFQLYPPKPVAPRGKLTWFLLQLMLKCTGDGRSSLIPCIQSRAEGVEFC